jgi:hypothetical protein
MYQYLVLFLTHATLSYFLNFFNKIWQCAFVFVLLVLLTNFIALAYNAKRTAQIVFPSIFLGFILHVNQIYFIQGEPVSGIFFASYLSVLISCGSSAFLCGFLYNKKKFTTLSSSLVSILFAAFVDGCIMAGFFISIYSMALVSKIFIKEVGLKFLYVSAIYFLNLKKNYRRSRETFSISVAQKV